MTKINATQILPIAMILLDVGAAVVCLCHKDCRRGGLLDSCCNFECKCYILTKKGSF